MNFGTIIFYQSMETGQNYATQILTALLFTLKPKIFLKIFLMILRNGFTCLIIIKRIKYLSQQGKKLPGLFKDELGGKILTEFAALRPKTYSYLDDNCNKHKKDKGSKKSVIKQKIMFQNFKDCLFNNKNVYRSQQRFKSYNHDVYTEEVNKIALSSNDDKRLQTFDGITTYPYGTNVFKVCENEMLAVKDLFFEKLQQNSVTTINIKMINFNNYVNENKTKHYKN